MSLYPELQRLDEERNALNARISEAMHAQFVGRRVRVNHYHGSFTGVVRQVGWHEFSVVVVNDVTGKASQRWPLNTSNGRPDVELIDSPTEPDGGDV